MPKINFQAAYSNNYNCWFVAEKITDSQLRLVWPCKSEKHAGMLINAINSGQVMCRGSKNFGTACEVCARCINTV